MMKLHKEQKRMLRALKNGRQSAIELRERFKVTRPDEIAHDLRQQGYAICIRRWPYGAFYALHSEKQS